MLVVRRGGRVGGEHRPGPLDQAQHPAYGPVQHVLGQRPGVDRRDHGGVAVTQGRRHLEVEAGLQGGDAVVHGAPVGHDEAVVPPLVAQHLGQQPVVLGGVGAVDLVVGAHHRPRPGRGDHALERGQVDLAQRALVDLGADPQPVVLLVVGSEVLHRGADALRLDGGDHRDRELAGQERVLGEVLEVASAQWGALHVDAGPEDDRDALHARLLRQGRADLGDQVAVPGRRDGAGRGEAGGREAPADPGVVGLLRLHPQTVGPVGDHDRRQAEPLDRAGVPEVPAHHEPGLLLDRELCGQLLDVAHLAVSLLPRGPMPGPDVSRTRGGSVQGADGRHALVRLARRTAAVEDRQ